MKKWLKLSCLSKDLQLKGTLNGGQSFRWKEKELDNELVWIGVFQSKVWVLKQQPKEILYQVHEKPSTKHLTEKEYNQILTKYFRLNTNLQDCYEEWSKKDKYFNLAAKNFYGIRQLDQELTETLFSFICSANNNISRITGMVEKLATFYGEKIVELNKEQYYAFPTVENLGKNPAKLEVHLRDLGFGYRAKYIRKSVEKIQENGGQIWLDKLKLLDYNEAKKSLMSLTGIGNKVADCICLMSLNHLEVVPVDTHILQIAQRLYMPSLKSNKTKAVSEKMGIEIGDFFRDLHGPKAGWAQTVLFCADLKKFQENQQLEETTNKRQKTK